MASTPRSPAAQAEGTVGESAGGAPVGEAASLRSPHPAKALTATASPCLSSRRRSVFIVMFFWSPRRLRCCASKIGLPL